VRLSVSFSMPCWQQAACTSAAAKAGWPGQLLLLLLLSVHCVLKTCTHCFDVIGWMVRWRSLCDSCCWSYGSTHCVSSC
jgi:hypothetical protein